ncbi:uncharacterized protein LOC104444760 isoform X2 [Eucalyptus grandis]|uniref:uncharacterized protein LOC104444760 isoform X2 n=1 Tax=Eucalyptus grandis TaxID=71139 RepID=UPI00192EA11C|nr:uncharacterized protein LOC104444760 isoform X2 [Eucalyptus grandis]
MSVLIGSLVCRCLVVNSMVATLHAAKSGQSLEGETCFGQPCSSSWVRNWFLVNNCVIVEDGNVIAARRNLTIETRNATRHAEIEALDVLLEQWQRTGLLAAEVAKKFSICSLYVTFEPCIMKINGDGTCLWFQADELVMGILDQRVSNVVEV